MEGFVDGSGLFAVVRHRDAAHLTWLGLHALQHRGNGGAGLAASDGDLVRYRHGVGAVPEALPAGSLAALTGSLAVGQIYGRGLPGAPALEGDAGERMLFGRWAGGQLAVALAGRFTNGTRLRRELKERGALFHTASDAEVLVHLLAHSGQRTFVNRLVDALWKVDGAFTAVVCSEDRVVAVRDPRGFRPLLLGRLGEAALLSSDDAAIRFVGGTVQRELQPGEMVILDERGAQTVQPFPKRRRSACAQELVALARSDAQAFGSHAYDVRLGLGQRLAREAPCPDARVVVGLPGAAEPIAIGYGRAARIPCERGLLGLPWAGRVDEPAGGASDLDARSHLAVVPAVVEGRPVVLVTPTLVTGQGVRAAATLLREAGASAVHVRVASPLVRSSCFYGVSSPTVDELLANRNQAVADALGATSLACLSMEAMLDQLGHRSAEQSFCHACFDGEFPLPPEEPDDQLPLF